MDLSPSITFLDISQNYMTGELPAAVAGPNMTFFDASYNRLNGTINIYSARDVSTADKSTLRLEVNRLSGDVPSTLKNAKNINVLKTNVFACSTNKSALPVNDPNDLQYQCGSNAYNRSLYFFVASMLSICVMWTYCSSWSVTAEISEWMSSFHKTEDITRSWVCVPRLCITAKRSEASVGLCCRWARVS